MAKNTDITKSDLLGGYQIIGGIIGIVLTIIMVKNLTVYSLPMVFIIIIAFLLYAFSIFCGISILSNLTKGLYYSKINQLLQAFNFYILGYGFQYASGIFLHIGIDLSESFNLNFNFGTSSWQIAFGQSSDKIEANINLVAIFLLVFIDKKNKEINDLKLEAQLVEIG